MTRSRITLLGTGLAVGALSAGASAQLSFTGPMNVATGLQPDHATFADLDGDGDLDMAVTIDSPDRVELYANNGGGTLSLVGSIQTGSGSSPAAVRAADMDADGDQDMVVTLKNINSVRVLVNNGGFSFALGSSASTGAEPRQLALRDFNGDGRADVATSNREGNNVSIALNNAGALGATTNVAVGAEPRHLASGDFDGDGDVDLAVAIHDDRRIDILTNNGGSFALTASPSVGGQLRPDGIDGADLDGDGDVDLAAATSGNAFNFVSVFTNAGGTFSGPFNFASGGINPGAIAAGDLDGDGDVDVAVVNEDSNSLALLANTGAAAFGAPTTFAAGTTPEDVTLGDLDGNGGLDVGVANRDSNNVSIYMNQNGGGSGTTSYCVSAPNSSGPGAVISSNGSLSIAANTFALAASGATPNQPGIFYYGTGQTQVPFGEGFRCVNGTTFRLNPASPSSPTGTNARRIDFTAPPADSGAGQITPGSTWNFQFWYRDPSGGPNGFNLSNGLSATFLP